MARAHRLHGLTLAAVWRAPQCPKLFAANSIATVPEFSGDTAVAGILEHTNLFASLDFPTYFRGELKLVTPIVDGPGTVRFHPDAVAGAGNQFVRGSFVSF